MFYILAKVHKSPWKTCPVVSCTGSLLAAVSTWLDFHLQKLRKFLPSFIKDSANLQADLEKLGILPDSAKMFTTDATAMYTNIDLDHLLEAMDAWLKEHKDELPKGFPTKLIMEALELVMKSNVFSFSNTWWKQLIGTAMGTLCAYSLSMPLLFGLQMATSENQNKPLPNSKRT
eukprot:1867542-Ditylum_brightwellii.AAC.1